LRLDTSAVIKLLSYAGLTIVANVAIATGPAYLGAHAVF